MLNIFYLYGGMWLIILLLYSLGWSDLCIPLSDETLCFVLFMIFISFICGYFLRKRFRFNTLKNNPHKKYIITICLVAFYIADFIYERKIPLLNVLLGKSMYENSFVGIPKLHFLVSGFIFIYCFYLAYLFVCFKKKSLLIEYLLSLSIFVLLFQRQNIMIILLGTLWIIIASLRFKTLTAPKKIICIVAIVVIILVALYVFGIMGNARYGLWNSNDASMIIAVGKINNNFPDFIPKSYAWAYIYAISPLSNLQYNIDIGIDIHATFIDILWQYLPNFVSKNLSVQSNVQSYLIVSSLNVCTAFSDVYRASGFIGMCIFFLVETFIVIITVLMFKNNHRYRIAAYVSVAYFYLLSFFNNPVIYDITAEIILYLWGFWLVLSSGIKFTKSSLQNKEQAIKKIDKL